MPPPAFRVPHVELFSPISLYPTLADLCANRPQEGFESGVFDIADTGRESDLWHASHDGYFYRLFRQGQHVGWQWQDVLRFLSVPDDKRDYGYLDSLEIFSNAFEGKWKVGKKFSTPVPVIGWRRLQDVGMIDCRKTFSPKTIVDAGTFGCDCELFDVSAPFIDERVSFYLLHDRDGEEFWSFEELMEAALKRKGPEQVVAEIEG